MSAAMGKPDWGEIERVLGRMLELPEDRQPAYLAQQPAAVRDEVQSLLDAYRRSGGFLGEESKTVSAAEMLGRLKAIASEGGVEGAAPAAITAGTQLGPYRIETVLGEGGMGVVYRALDTRLNRPVAVKFLFDDLADAAARRRFQREAQTVSSLNHPHILTVYDAGDFEGRQYLVTEFVDGGTLRDWAQAEKRTWKEIVTLLVGVADGLAAAHAAAILHRDIKPDNVLVGRNGYAKLSDFGLAKLAERPSAEAVTRTMGSSETRPGVILGTFAYMSPEQASGRPTDARSDIFSFGIVLYELLAGRRPFDAPTDLELLQTIIHRAPAPLDAGVPLALRMAVEKALEKDPAERYQSTRDLVVDLRRLLRLSVETAGSAAAIPPPAARSRTRTRVLLAIAGLAVLLAAGMLFMWLKRPAAEAARQAVQFDIAPPAGAIFAPPIMRKPFAISPDGARLAFTSTGPTGTFIWVRDLASLEMKPIPGTEDAETVFWSPDSRSVYYSVKRSLKQADVDSGSGHTVMELPERAQLGTWRSPGDLILYVGGGSNYLELSVANRSLRTLSLGHDNMRWPQFLPGGDHFVYVAVDPSIRAMVADANAAQRTPLMETDSRVEYAPPRRPGELGHLLFLRGASLMAQAFDASRLRLAGEPFAIARNVVYYGSTLSPAFSVSDNGVLVYQAEFPVSELKWYDRTGKEAGSAGRPSAYWGTLRVAPDGRRAAAVIFGPENGGTDLWIFDAAGRESRQLTFAPEQARRPVWSPDGKRLAYGHSMPGGHPEIATIAIEDGKEQPLVSQWPQKVDGLPSPRGMPTDWSRDGRFVAFDSGIPEEGPDLWIGDLAAGKIMPLLNGKFAIWGTAFAPDGRQIAFVSTESGRPEVYLQKFEPDPKPHVSGERRQVSRDGAWLVRWRGDGQELFYLGTDNWVNAVKVGGLLQFGDPAKLFHVPGTQQYDTTRDFQFDVSPDGQKFLMTTTGSVPPPPYTVIQNWQDKFRK